MANSSTTRLSYQVFLSFRGEDIRKTFIDHLYTALTKTGIRTFKDDEELEKGKNIESELLTMILQSEISVIIISKNYASSRWCLDELVKILECKEATGRIVFPIFYHVEPSQVRNLTGSFADAFRKHEERFMMMRDETKRQEWIYKTTRWKAALIKVADLVGMVLQNEHEAKFIEEIVKVVEDRLKHTGLDIPPHVIGFDSRVRSINMWLQDGSSEVGTLAIYGIGGIGKTTIAKLVYNLNYRRFEASSFLANVRETLEKSDGLLRLHKQLLSDLLKKRETIFSPEEGINKITNVISCKRILLVVDDVDEKDQIDAILGMQHLFYPGSKIILTTRQEGSLMLKPCESGRQLWETATKLTATKLVKV